MTIYLACIDHDGTLRSNVEPEKAFTTWQAAQTYLDEKKAQNWGYDFRIVPIELDDQNQSGVEPAQAK